MPNKMKLTQISYLVSVLTLYALTCDITIPFSSDFNITCVVVNQVGYDVKNCTIETSSGFLVSLTDRGKVCLDSKDVRLSIRHVRETMISQLQGLVYYSSAPNFSVRTKTQCHGNCPATTPNYCKAPSTGYNCQGGCFSPSYVSAEQRIKESSNCPVAPYVKCKWCSLRISYDENSLTRVEKHNWYSQDALYEICFNEECRICQYKYMRDCNGVTFVSETKTVEDVMSDSKCKLMTNVKTGAIIYSLANDITEFSELYAGWNQFQFKDDQEALFRIQSTDWSTNRAHLLSPFTYGDGSKDDCSSSSSFWNFVRHYFINYSCDSGKYVLKSDSIRSASDNKALCPYSEIVKIDNRTQMIRDHQVKGSILLSFLSMEKFTHVVVYMSNFTMCNVTFNGFYGQTQKSKIWMKTDGNSTGTITLNLGSDSLQVRLIESFAELYETVYNVEYVQAIWLGNVVNCSYVNNLMDYKETLPQMQTVYASDTRDSSSSGSDFDFDLSDYKISVPLFSSIALCPVLIVAMLFLIRRSRKKDVVVENHMNQL